MILSVLSEIVNICFLIGKRWRPAVGTIWRYGHLFLHEIWAIWTVSDSLVDYRLCFFSDFVLQSLLLQIAHGLLEEEAAEAEQEKQQYMEENCPALSLPGSMQELQVHTHTHHQMWCHRPQNRPRITRLQYVTSQTFHNPSIEYVQSVNTSTNQWQQM